MPADPTRLRRRGGALITALALGAAAVLAAPAAAQAQGSDGAAVVVEDARLHPSLAGVQVDGAGRDAVVGGYRVAVQRLTDARDALAGTESDAATATQDRARNEAEVAAATAERDAAASRATGLRSTLRNLAVHSYMQGSRTGSTGTDATAATEALRQQAVVDTVSAGQADDLRSTLATLDRASRQVDDGTAEVARLTALQADLEQRRASQADEVARATADATRARAALADWRLTADVAGSDIPLVVLDAYVKAAERMAFERPECGLRWWGLAGIGWAESRHGTEGGARPGPDGVIIGQIVGIPLDGTNNTALIADTDGGALDGDPVFDRAVGPMQFIPGTWRTLGRDGDGDGRADPHNIRDAALSAAGLLCRSGGQGLDTPEGLRRGALGYNASGVYADTVVRQAFAYAARADQLIPPPPPPAPDPLAVPVAVPPAADPGATTTTTAVAVALPPVTAAPQAPPPTP